MEQNTNACFETELFFSDQWIIKYFLLCNATSNEIKIAKEIAWEICRTCVAALFPTGLTTSCITWKNLSTFGILTGNSKAKVFRVKINPCKKACYWIFHSSAVLIHLWTSTEMVNDISGDLGGGDPDPCSSPINLVLSSKRLRFVPQRLHTTKTPPLRVLRLPSLFRRFYYSLTFPAAHRSSLFPCPARLGTALLQYCLEKSATAQRRAYSLPLAHHIPTARPQVPGSHSMASAPQGRTGRVQESPQTQRYAVVTSA